MNFLQKPSLTWQKFRDFAASPSHSRTMGIVIMLVLVSAVSLTVIASQQQQTIKQRASGAEGWKCIRVTYYNSDCSNDNDSETSSESIPGCQDSDISTTDCTSSGNTSEKISCFQSSDCPIQASAPTPDTRFTCSDIGGDKYRCRGDPDKFKDDNKVKNACGSGWTYSPYNDSIGTTCWEGQICCYQSATASTTEQPATAISTPSPATKTTPVVPPATPTFSPYCGMGQSLCLEGYECKNMSYGFNGKCELKPLAAVSKAPASAPQAPASGSGECSLKSQGDANCDGKINILDYNIWRDEVNRKSQTKRADFNGNGEVGADDLNTWQNSMKDKNLLH